MSPRISTLHFPVVIAVLLGDSEYGNPGSCRILRQRLSEDRLHRGYTTIPTQQKIDAFALLIRGSIQVVPFAADGNVRLVYTSGRADSACASIRALLELGNIPNDPP